MEKRTVIIVPLVKYYMILISQEIDNWWQSLVLWCTIQTERGAHMRGIVREHT